MGKNWLWDRGKGGEGSGVWSWNVVWPEEVRLEWVWSEDVGQNSDHGHPRLLWGLPEAHTIKNQLPRLHVLTSKSLAAIRLDLDPKTRSKLQRFCDNLWKRVKLKVEECNTRLTGKHMNKGMIAKVFHSCFVTIISMVKHVKSAKIALFHLAPKILNHLGPIELSLCPLMSKLRTIGCRKCCTGLLNERAHLLHEPASLRAGRPAFGLNWLSKGSAPSIPSVVGERGGPNASSRLKMLTNSSTDT